MLDMIEEILPLGAEEWDNLASRFNSSRNVNQRDADSLKAKFRSWEKARKPTGAKGGRERESLGDALHSVTHIHIYSTHTHTYIYINIFRTHRRWYGS